MPKKDELGKGTLPEKYVLNLLSRRDYTVMEMRRKLKTRQVPETHIDHLIRELHSKKLLDDESFAKRYVRSAIMNRAVGRKWITQKLRQKGVALSIIETQLNEQLSPETEQELLLKAAESWQRRQSPTKATPDRLARFLLSRGFPPHLVQDYLSDFAQSSDAVGDGRVSSE